MARLCAALLALVAAACESPLEPRSCADGWCDDAGTGTETPDGAAAGDASGASNLTDHTRPYDCDDDTIALYHFDGDLTSDCGGPSLSGPALFADRSVDGFDQVIEVSPDGILLASSDLLPATTEFTIEAWVRLDFLPDPEDYSFVVAIDDGTTGGVQWYLAVTGTGAVAVAKALEDCTSLDPDLGVLTAPILAPEVWTHIRASFDGSSYRIWVDGALQVTLPPPLNTSTCAHATADLSVGYAGNGSQPFDGRIDELRYSAKARVLSDGLLAPSR